MNKRWTALVLALLMLCAAVLPASAAGADDLFFVAVNDSIPLTITGAKPHYAATGLYVPYTVFDAAPGGVAQAYNAAEQTLVLFNRSGRLVFDLDSGTVTDESGAVSDVLTSAKTSTTARNTSDGVYGDLEWFKQGLLLPFSPDRLTA